MSTLLLERHLAVKFEELEYCAERTTLRSEYFRSERYPTEYCGKSLSSLLIAPANRNKPTLVGGWRCPLWVLDGRNEMAWTATAPGEGELPLRIRG